ncbi:MAG: disulfide bond formation protein B [Rickettsiales bacterium]|nr:disulfide bond formation protein B [Rickettsiales bacterium]
MKIHFSYRNLLILLGLSSFIALLGAYIAEFGFNLQPCILCLYQRKPFFGIIALTILAIALFKNKEYQRLAFFGCLILLFINILIASYHVGVEQKIFKGPSSCSNSQNLNQITDLEELEKALAKASTIKCSEPAFILLNISMAGWNVIYCLALLLLAILKRPKDF